MIMRLKEMKGGRWFCWEWLNLNMGWIMWMEKIQVMNLNSCWTIYIDGEDPCNESEYVLDYIYIDGEGQVMNLNIGCIMLIEKFQVKIIRADNFRIVS